ncbi:unnamed protein product [Gadus morhua 'NCC']
MEAECSAGTPGLRVRQSSCLTSTVKTLNEQINSRRDEYAACDLSRSDKFLGSTGLLLSASLSPFQLPIILSTNLTKASVLLHTGAPGRRNPPGPPAERAAGG